MTKDSDLHGTEHVDEKSVGKSSELALVVACDVVGRFTICGEHMAITFGEILCRSDSFTCFATLASCASTDGEEIGDRKSSGNVSHRESSRSSLNTAFRLAIAITSVGHDLAFLDTACSARSTAVVGST